MSRTHIIQKQRQRRQTREVKRVEFILDSSINEHHEINAFLNSLPRGEGGEFIRQAILEKIAREHQPETLPEPAPAASEQIEQLFAELDYQRREASEQIEVLYQELADEKRRAGHQLEAMIAELVALREAVSAPAPVAATVTPQEQTLPAPEPPPARPESPGTTVSSGLDMSRPRPRKQPGKQPPAPPRTLPEIDEPPFDAEASRRLLVESIKAFGKNRDGS